MWGLLRQQEERAAAHRQDVVAKIHGVLRGNAQYAEHGLQTQQAQFRNELALAMNQQQNELNVETQRVRTQAQQWEQAEFSAFQKMLQECVPSPVYQRTPKPCVSPTNTFRVISVPDPATIVPAMFPGDVWSKNVQLRTDPLLAVP